MLAVLHGFDLCRLISCISWGELKLGLPNSMVAGLNLLKEALKWSIPQSVIQSLRAETAEHPRDLISRVKQMIFHWINYTLIHRLFILSRIFVLIHDLLRVPIKYLIEKIFWILLFSMTWLLIFHRLASTLDYFFEGKVTSKNNVAFNKWKYCKLSCFSLMMQY